MTDVSYKVKSEGELKQLNEGFKVFSKVYSLAGGKFLKVKKGFSLDNKITTLDISPEPNHDITDLTPLTNPPKGLVYSANSERICVEIDKFHYNISFKPSKD